MWYIFRRCHVVFLFVLTGSYDTAKCDAISNTKFNSHIRDFKTEDSNNIKNITTLQKEESGRYANFAPAGNPITFKEIPDSALSSSSSGRGLLYHDQPGYTLNDYEESPHYPYLHDGHPDDHGPHGYDHDHHNYHNHHDYHDHHNPYDNDHHHYGGHHYPDHGHYNKHFKHALAAKTVLWPIAGLALLGAAAALVSNPVLLQLGVISGKRRRRDTEEVTGPDFPILISKYEENIIKQLKENTNKDINRALEKNTNINYNDIGPNNEKLEKRILKLKEDKRNMALKKKHTTVKRNVDQITKPKHYIGYLDDDRYIPIPIKLRSPYLNTQYLNNNVS